MAISEFGLCFSFCGKFTCNNGYSLVNNLCEKKQKMPEKISRDAKYGHGRDLYIEREAHDLGVTCCDVCPLWFRAGDYRRFVIKLFSPGNSKLFLIIGFFLQPTRFCWPAAATTTSSSSGWYSAAARSTGVRHRCAFTRRYVATPRTFAICASQTTATCSPPGTSVRQKHIFTESKQRRM